MYCIETRDSEPRYHEGDPDTWTTDGLGDDNEFKTKAEAEAMIPELRKLGPDWGAADYRVVLAD